MVEVDYGPDIWLRDPIVDVDSQHAQEPVDETTQGVPPGCEFSWFGVHGGAGATTLAALAGGVDVGRRWPNTAQGEPPDLLLVARTHAAGLTAVSQTLDLFRRGHQPEGLRIIAVVLVADAPGRVPRDLNKRIRIISSASSVFRIPWVPAWRRGEFAGNVPRELGVLTRKVGTPTQ
ncbi:DUF6668 family protein [Streptomyces sp. NPDC059816]|uniref:DUF6668 family protein n=1 Tax=Streptomyces sp. NPDC059816 TaxID=3346960 RepID=UPI00365B58A7